VVLKLHDWDVDFAAWCSYKYLNAGPGAVAGCFVHARHGRTQSLPRLAGWWGNDPRTRFQMRPEFVPREGADGWQVSNPPILAMAPLLASLQIFDEAGMPALRQRLAFKVASEWSRQVEGSLREWRLPLEIRIQPKGGDRRCLAFNARIDRRYQISSRSPGTTKWTERFAPMQTEWRF
jgi:kynureninase